MRLVYTPGTQRTRARPCPAGATVASVADEVGALAERMRPTLLAWARRRFADYRDHEDVLQDVLAR